MQCLVDNDIYAKHAFFLFTLNDFYLNETQILVSGSKLGHPSGTGVFNMRLHKNK